MSLFIIDKNSKLIKLSSMHVIKDGEGSPKFSELIDGSIQTIEQNDLKDVASIRNGVFADLSIKSVDMPSNVTSIGDSAFANNQISTLSLGEGVVTIGDSAFANNQISTLTIPQNVTTIGDSAFQGNELTEITMESDIPPSVTSTTFPSTLQTTNVGYNGYENYATDPNWQTYKDTLVRGLAIPSTITVIVNNYLNELVNGASVTITGNGQTYTGTTNENGVFVQGDLQPATYTISVADIDGFKTPKSVEVIVEENTQHSEIITYLEKPAYTECDPVFANNSPATISAVSAEISANEMTSQQVAETYGWNLGDTKEITLSTGEVIQMQIIGFNHDDKSDGSGKAGITLQTVDCLKTICKFGWTYSTFRTSELPTITNSLPQEWKDVIKFVDKKYANGGYTSYTETLTVNEDLFLLSEIELFGQVINAKEGDKEGFVYEYWIDKTDTDRDKKYDKNLDGVAEESFRWWLRSAAMYGTNAAVSVQGGTSTTTNYTYKAAVSFAFCV